MTAAELEQLKQLQAKQEAAKLEETKVDPQIKVLEKKLKDAQEEADKLAVNLKFLSTTDYEDIKKKEVKDHVVALLKDYWALDELVETEQKKLETLSVLDKMTYPSKTSVVELISRLNEKMYSMFGHVAELFSAQNWGEHNEHIDALTENTRKRQRAYKADVFEDIAASEYCTCGTGENQCGTKRCPCHKAGRQCQLACRCTEAYCNNPCGGHPKEHVGHVRREKPVPVRPPVPVQPPAFRVPLQRYAPPSKSILNYVLCDNNRYCCVRPISYGYRSHEFYV
jgi:hypothetical protein